MKNDEKTECLPIAQDDARTSFAAGSAAAAPARAAGEQDSEQTVLRAPTEVAPTPSIRTRRSRPCVRSRRRRCRTLQPRRQLRRRVRADVANRRGRQSRTHRRCRRPAHRSPTGTQVMANRLVGSLEDAGEGHHGQLQPGSVIKKRFVLDTLIGKGGMGLVFGAIDRRKEEAHDPNPRVALKVLNADFQRHPQSFMALQREARKAQTLAHPNVVTVFDFDRDGDAVYMTMELLKGRALESMVREARGKGIGARARAADHPRHRRRPRVRASQRHRAFGPEARQRVHRRGRHAEDPRLRHRARGAERGHAKTNRDVFDAGSLGAYTEAYATDEMVDGVDPHPADDMYALGIIALRTAHRLPSVSASQRAERAQARHQAGAAEGTEAQRSARDRTLPVVRSQAAAAEMPANSSSCSAASRRCRRRRLRRAPCSRWSRDISGIRTTWRPARRFRSASCRARHRRSFARTMAEGNEFWGFFERRASDRRRVQRCRALRTGVCPPSAQPRSGRCAEEVGRCAARHCPASTRRLATRSRRTLQTKSAFYEKYAPVVDAVA